MWLPTPAAQAYQGQALRVLKKISTYPDRIFSKNLDSLTRATWT